MNPVRFLGEAIRTASRSIAFLWGKQGAERTQLVADLQAICSRCDDAYAAVHWNPEVSIDNKAYRTYSNPWSGEEDIRLYIEGMGSQGSLISTSRLLRVGEKVTVE